MKKSVKSPFSTLLIAFVIFYSLSGTGINRTLEMLLRQPFSLRRIQMLIQHSPGTFLTLLAYCICIIVMVVSLIRLIASMGRRGSAGSGTAAASMKGQAARSAPRYASAPRPERARRKERPVRVGEDAIHCEHKRGTEKYLQQIDGYLKAGLIDRAEYKTLYKKYSQLDIPDDYH